jgi:cation diffusion facilitator CzcD-associated flavoprotein CzcO
MSGLSRKCVGIIGAGVSGLVSAVNMYKVDIQPIVFDKASDIGGMWNVDLKPCWNSMRTNISKFSTALSDFSWPKDASIFPSQREVYQYLLNYVQQSLPKDVFRLNTQVINVFYSNDKWTIEYRTKSNEISSEQFDFVIIASGFFDCPHIPDNITDLSSFQGTLLHSCDYRSPEQVRNKRVIIAGASMSAAEIAADMATSAEHITHIVPHCFWSMPRFKPLIPNDPTSPFLPIDLVMFRRSKRKSSHEIILRNSDENKRINEYFRLITDNSQKSSKLIDANDEKPGFIAISDMYAEWTRADKITLKQGRLVKVENDGTSGIIIKNIRI